MSRAKRLLTHSASRYFVVGIGAFTSDYFVLLLFFYVFNFPLKISTALGFLTGFCISFSTNKRWVFSGSIQRKNLTRQICEYITLIVFNLLFTVWAVNFLNNHGIEPVIGKLAVMVLIMCWNYALFRWVIFVGEAK